MTERYERPFDHQSEVEDRPPWDTAERPVPDRPSLDSAWPSQEASAYAAEDVVEDVVEEEDEVEEAWERELEEEFEPGQPETQAEAEPEPEPEPEPVVEHAPAGLEIPSGYRIIEGEVSGGRRSVAVVVSRFNGEITNRMLARALDELELHGLSRDAVTIVPVPGAFELPLATMALAKTRRYACIVALGCVIRGETAHFEYVSSEAASGLQLAALETGIPIAFGVLTVDSREQAEARVERADDAVRSALEMADMFARLRAEAAG